MLIEHMMLAFRALGLLSLAGLLPAQSPTAFEVASVKPSASSGNARTIQVNPGMVSIRSMSLRDLALRAYGRGRALQVSREDLVASGLKWYEDDLFDVDAKPGGNPFGSGEEVSAMLQALLVERFKLAFHQETRETSGYLLAAVKGGVKMRARTAGDGGEARVLGRTKRGAHGEMRLEMRDVPLAAVAAYLGNMYDRPVADQTDLTGTYDLDLEWTTDEIQFGGRFAAGSGESTLPGLFTALREQCGLRLESGKLPVNVLVIDHAEKPSAN
jgi:uncharacterized protein (TIGR03435 family)